MMAKNRCYVVWVGRNPGIYDTWGECEAQVKEYSGAKFKGFRSKEAARKAFSQPYKVFIPEDKKPAPRIARSVTRTGRHKLDKPAFPRNLPSRKV